MNTRLTLIAVISVMALAIAVLICVGRYAVTASATTNNWLVIDRVTGKAWIVRSNAVATPVLEWDHAQVAPSP